MKIALVFLTVLVAAARLEAQMSDSDAMVAAHAALGPLADVGMVRNWSDTYWTRQIAVKSPGCNTPVTVLAAGSNTWDAAFAAFQASPPQPAGPYSAKLTISMQAWDNVGVAGFSFVIDGMTYPEIQIAPAPTWSVAQILDTTALADGLHVLCAHARDAAGNVGSSRAYLFTSNQASGMANGLWVPSQLSGGPPVISAP